MTFTHVPTVEPTCTDDGNIEYFLGSNGKYYADENVNTEIAPEDIVIDAEGHKFGKPTWKISSKGTATETFKCTECGEEVVLDADVTRKQHIEPTCTESGKDVYTAKVTFEGMTYSCDKSVTLPATGHAYSEPVWTWSKDNKATAKFTCGTCGDVEIIDASVITETTKPTFKADGKIVYTAKVTFDGKEYTDIREVKLDKLNGDITISYKPGNKCVKLTWTSVENAEKYAVYGYLGGQWQKLTEGYDTSYVIEKLAPGKEYKVAVIVKVNGIWNTDVSNAITITPNKPKPTTPELSYQPGNGCVKLEWTEVEDAEKYAICGYLGGKWKLIEMGYANSYILKGLRSGVNYKVAVIAKTDGQWNMDFSNAITVTPNEVKPTAYPEITSIDYDAIDHMVTLNWTKVEGATGYAVAVKTAGKWKARAYTNGNITTLTSPKLKPGMTYEVVICAKVDGKWETENMNSRTFTVTVK